MTQEAFDPRKHIPVKEAIPVEESVETHERADIPPPSAYARTAVVTHRRTKERAIVHRVDLMTRQLRLWYPARLAQGYATADQFDTRTGWQSFEEWEPEIMFSPEEIHRQQAKQLFEEELQSFDAAGLSMVTVLCDDPDPVKALAKIKALKQTPLFRGMSAAAPEPVAEDLTPPEEPKKKGSK